MCGHMDVVKQHIDAGVNLNEQDGQGWTPLTTALANGRLEMVDLLIQHGADVNMKANYDESALFGVVR